MAQVFEAVDLQLQRNVAIKLLRLPLASDRAWEYWRQRAGAGDL